MRARKCGYLRSYRVHIRHMGLSISHTKPHCNEKTLYSTPSFPRVRYSDIDNIIMIAVYYEWICVK